jgi:3-hydroxyisobutyrate dehydrogenase-like beta-hydroxyacid dehydrogenase
VRPIILWNRTASLANTHSSQIGHSVVAKAISDAVSKSDMVWSCFADEPAVMGIFDTILKGDIKGKLFVECSTNSPESTNELAQRVIEAGGEFVAMPGNTNSLYI